MSLHEVVRGSGQAVFLYGTGFSEVTQASVGDVRVEVRVDGDDTITIYAPDLEPNDYWVQVHAPDGSSPLSDGQQTLRITAAEGGHGALLELTGLTPTEITLGRSAAYWLHGYGLSGVTAVFLGSVGCRFEGYDDTRLVIYSPEHVPEMETDGMLKIQAIGTAGNGEFDVYCRVPETPLSFPIDPAEQRYPMILAIDPTNVGMAGGRVRVSGANFTMATRFLLGDVECQVSDISESALTATVPPAAGYDGQFLLGFVMDREVAGTNTGEHGVTITGAV
jgi:hypothetical protein